MSEELVQLILNHHGRDVEIVVDLETANVLLNDPSQAEAYLAQLSLSGNADNESGAEAAEADDEEPKNDNERQQQELLLWSSKGKPEANDIKGTEHFLQLRAKYASQFDDKKTIKSKLWQKIATEMEEAGFKLGPGAAEKCRQKFQNLSKLYMKHRQHMKRTGTENRDPPHYYNLMHSIVGGKDKVNPQHLQDSFTAEDDDMTDQSVHEPSTSATPDEPRDESPSSAENGEHPKNRFKGAKKINRPKSNNEQLLEFLKKEAEVQKEDRERQFSLLEKLVNNHCRQQEKLFAFLAKKRRRDESETDSD